MLGTLSRIIIFAGEPGRCAGFFREYFGFASVGEWTSEWAELDAGGCRLAFHQAWAAEGPLREPTGAPSNPHKLVFTVADVALARYQLVSSGVALGQIRRFQDAVGNPVEICDGTDPEGHVFQLSNR